MDNQKEVDRLLHSRLSLFTLCICSVLSEFCLAQVPYFSNSHLTKCLNLSNELVIQLLLNRRLECFNWRYCIITSRQQILIFLMKLKNYFIRMLFISSQTKVVQLTKKYRHILKILGPCLKTKITKHKKCNGYS